MPLFVIQYDRVKVGELMKVGLYNYKVIKSSLKVPISTKIINYNAKLWNKTYGDIYPNHIIPFEIETKKWHMKLVRV